MKLQYLIVVFIIIFIPIMLLLNYYMSLQQKTINLQTEYDSKLIASAKQSMEAFEVNTVEWDNGFSRYSDSKRRDILAAINTFTNSYANSLGITGISRGSILTYIPAIMFNLSDGYYIYAPTQVPVVKNNSNGVQLFGSAENIYTTNSIGQDGNPNSVLYVAAKNGDTYYQDLNHTNPITGITTKIDDAKKEYKHILKTFVPYSEEIGSTIVNYSLDNYIKVYTESMAKEGYLIDTSQLKSVSALSPTNSLHIKYNDTEISPEILKENVAYVDDRGNIQKREYMYVYNINNEKCYYDSDQSVFFKIINNQKVNLDNNCQVGAYNCEYKQILLLNRNGEIIKILQPLNGDFRYWLFDSSIINHPENRVAALINNTSFNGIRDWEQEYANIWSQPYLDYSAFNYYTESYAFTKWVNSLNLGSNLNISSANNPEDENSLFSIHKKEVMKNSIISNLNLAISSYSANSNLNYTLPEFNYEDWEQILSNISMTAFVQGIPIGLKDYNNYVISISTNNREYIDKNEIYYISNNPDYYYHSRLCNKIPDDADKIVGYRNIDFIIQTIETSNSTEYYYKHAIQNTLANEKCYYCLISKISIDNTKEGLYKKAYLHSIAREREVQPR